MTEKTRVWAASAALSLWLVMLLIGWVLGGAVHGLLVFACLIFPWRTGRPKALGDHGASREDKPLSLSSVPSEIPDSSADGSSDQER